VEKNQLTKRRKCRSAQLDLAEDESEEEGTDPRLSGPARLTHQVVAVHTLAVSAQANTFKEKQT